LVEKMRVAVVFGSVGLHDPAMADDADEGPPEGEGEDEGEGGQQQEAAGAIGQDERLPPQENTGPDDGWRAAAD
jgi:hypothetical protein